MKRDFLERQLSQIFIYSEMLAQILELKELLNPVDGYVGEDAVCKKLTELEEEIRTHLNKHLSNADISRRARAIINNIQVMERAKQKEEKSG
jgi:hypothetical protein